MNTKTLRTTAIAGVAAIAFVTAGSLAAPTEAHAGGKAAAAFVGGLLVGGIAASAYPAYGAPVYGAYYGPSCHWQKQKVWDPYYGYYTWRKVKVCY